MSKSAISWIGNSDPVSPLTSRGVRTPAPPMTAIFTRVPSSWQLAPSRQAIDTAGSQRRSRADEVAGFQALARASSTKQREEEPPVERVAGAGGVDRRHARRGNSNVEGIREPAAATVPELDDRVARGPQPEACRERGPARPRVHRRFRFVDEDVVHGSKQRVEAGLRAQLRTPAEIP